MSSPVPSTSSPPTNEPIVLAFGKKCAKAANRFSAALFSISGSRSWLPCLLPFDELNDAVEVFRIADRSRARCPQPPCFGRNGSVDVLAAQQVHREANVLAHQLHREAGIELVIEDPRGVVREGRTVAAGAAVERFDQLFRIDAGRLRRTDRLAGGKQVHTGQQVVDNIRPEAPTNGANMHA